ncbi:MAG: MBG domain-containing protein [Candidatus Omnitrophota bacterium]
MKKIIFTIILTLIFSLSCGQLLFALPQGQTVESGSATFEQINANTLNITASNQTVINFNSFNIAQNEIVNFIQPSNDASVLSRVIGNAASQIFGSLYANGMLVLVNPNGIHFGPNANVQVNRFIASTLNITTNNFINGNYIFEHNANSPYSQILNEGNLATNTVALIGSAVNNIGIITAYAGTAHLASGDKATVSFDQMGLIQVEINQATSGQVCDSNGVTLEEAVANSGTIAAAQVFMTVKTAKNIFKQAVNQTGVVRANQVIKVGDAIRIVATGADVVASGTLDAGANGKILISSDESIKVNAKLNITGEATLAANNDIKVSADIAADSGDLSLLADYDLDGVGAFNQAAGTTISTTTSGDITIQSSGASTLANINVIGDLNLNQAGAVAIYNQQDNSQVRTAGSLYIGKGVTLNAANTEYSISRNWANSGLFNAGTSTVNLVSSQDANVLGANIFYNFNVTEPGKIVRFDTENPQAILNNLNLKGSYGNLLTLTSIDPLKQWSLNAQGESDIQYALVSNLLNIRAPPLKIIHSSSLGNNTNLDLDPFWTGNGATNNWSDANNWDTGTTPTEYDIVTFDGVTGNNPNKDSIVDAAFQGTIDDLNINGYTSTLTLARDLALRGNFNHQTGTFDAATYTVSFIDASKVSIISGNNTFYNLVCTTPGKIIKFEAGKTQTILNNLRIEGASGNLIRVSSTEAGSQWMVNALDQTKVNLTYIYVQDGNNVANYLMPMTLSLKGTNNSNWDLDYVWTGAIDGDLGKPGNYTCGGLVAEVVPTNTDTLTIPWLGDEANYPSSGTSNALLTTNNGNIFGGIFNGEVVNNGNISDDLEVGIFFKGKFTAHSGHIYGATFTGDFIWEGGSQFIIDIAGITSLTIASGATWDGAVFSLSGLGNNKFAISAPVTNNGTITGGGFSNTVLNNPSGTITGGGFLGVVTNDGTITGGDFYQTVIGANGIQSGINKSAVPVFTAEEGDLNNPDTWSWTMDGHSYTTEVLPEIEFANFGVIIAGQTSVRIDNYGSIMNGVYGGIINNSGLIGDGTFSGVVTNLMGIWGGTFAQALTNTGLIFGGTFNGVVTNNIAIGGGVFNSAVVNTYLIAGGVFNAAVTNDYYIQYGVFNNTVINNYYIQDGQFFGVVTNNSSIAGGNFYRTVGGYGIGDGTNKSDVPVFNGGDLDVAANWSVNGEPLSALPIDEAEVANSGIITGGSYSGEYFFNYNIIDGGEISGLIYNAGYIYSGEFNGLIANVGMISGGTFNNQVMGGSYELGGETYDSDQLINAGTISGGIFDGPVINIADIEDGVFFGVVTNTGAIAGGNFYQSVDGDIGGGIDKSAVPVFNGGDLDVAANWTINGATIEVLPSTGEAANIGTIMSGSTATDLDNYGTINGGTFTGTVTNQVGGIISAGVINGDFVQNDGLGPYNYTWTGAEDGNLNNVGNYSGGNGVPVSDDTLTIPDAGKINYPSEGTSNAGTLTNNGSILGGTFNGTVTNYGSVSISDDEGIVLIFQGTFINDGGEVSDGAYVGDFIWVSGSVGGLGLVPSNTKTLTIGAGNEWMGIETLGSYSMENGIFNVARPVINNGTINDGGFTGTVLNNGTINGGGFSGVVTNNGTVTGGNFYQIVLGTPVPVGSDKHLVPVFTGWFASPTVPSNWSVNGVVQETVPDYTVEFGNFALIGEGTFSAHIDNYYGIAAGTYNGTINSIAPLASGTFNAAIINNGAILDGTFNAEVVNNMYILGGIFNGEIVNNGVIIGGTFNGDVEYIGVTEQDVFPATYNANLILTGNCVFNIYSDTIVVGNLSIASGAQVNIADGAEISIDMLTLGEIGQVNGTWGITGSGATHENDVYFTIGTGVFNVITSAIKPTLTITANSASKIYGSTLTFAGTEFTAVGLVGSDTLNSVTLTSVGAASGANVNSYSIVPSDAVGTGLSNYNIVYENGSLTVNTKPVTVTANAQTKVYGASDPTLTYTATALVGEDVYTGALTRAVGTNVGDYAIGQGTLTAGSNYTITFVPANLTISAKPVTVTANAGQSKVYGAADPVFTYTADTLVGLDTYSGALSRAAGTDVGSYAINQGTLTAGTNYDITFVSANFTIAPKSVTVIADAQTKVYGAVDPIFTYTPSEAISFTGALARAAGETVTAGPYAINQGTLSAGSNYSINFVGANLTITTKPLTITADNVTKTFGDNLNFTGTEFTSSGLINSDLISSVTLTSSGAAASAGVNQSPYSIVASAAEGTGLSNYAITYQPGSLAINQSLTIMQGESVLYVSNLPTPLNISVPVFISTGVVPAVPMAMPIPVSAPLIIPMGVTPVFVNPAILPVTMPVIADVSNLSYSKQNFISNQSPEITNRLMFPHGSGIIPPGGMGVIPLGAEKPLAKPNLQQDKKSTDQEVFN